METILVNKKFNLLLKALSINDIDEFIIDSLVTEILYKISDHSEEIKHFETKYGKSFEIFKKEYESGKENFEKYDDFMAWEFSQQGKIYWEAILKNTKNLDLHNH